MKVLLSEQFEKDLNQIRTWSQMHNPHHEDLGGVIYETINRIRLFPKAFEERRGGYRRAPLQPTRFRLYYWLSESGTIVIERIIHEAQQGYDQIQ